MTDEIIKNLAIRWEDHMGFRELSENPAVAEIQWAEARELAEQDIWRERLDALRKLNLPDNAFEKAKTCSTSAIEKVMAAEGAIWPPSWQDRKWWVQIHGKDWSKIDQNAYKRLHRIKDKEISFCMHFFIEVAEQKERIKAYVIFCAFLQVDPDGFETEMQFHLWTQGQIFETLSAEMPCPDGPIKTDLKSNLHTFLGNHAATALLKTVEKLTKVSSQKMLYTDN